MAHNRNTSNALRIIRGERKGTEGDREEIDTPPLVLPTFHLTTTTTTSHFV